MSIIIDDAGVNGADGKNVYVGNLSWETDDAQLLELVSQYGIMVRTEVYRILEREGIELPRYAVLDRSLPQESIQFEGQDDR